MPSAAERSVLHVLPHPGGGGETYVDLLDGMPGYRFTKVYLAPSPRPRPSELARGVIGVMRRGGAYHVIHAHGDVGAGLCLPLLATRPSVVTMNGLHLSRRLGGVKRRGAVLNLRAVVWAAGCTICVCRSEHDYLGGIAGARASRRAVVVHNGVRIPTQAQVTGRLATRHELGIDASETVGIWVGGLDGHKDPMAAIHAAEAASVPLLVVGDGPLRSEVERAARRFARVLGRRDDVPRLLDAADFFVLTSHREGFSFALLEAMAHGLPAVVPPLPENVEAVGDAGVAVRTDVGTLTSALRRLADDAVERAELGRRASLRVSERFTASEMQRRTQAVYDDLLAASSRSATR